jgi:serine/threonine-protein kinase RsbW
MTRAEEIAMAQMQPSCTLVVPSDLRMLSVVRAFVEAVCQANALDKRALHAVILATGEAVSNVIRHAHRDKPDAQLQIQCIASDDTFEVSLQDEGEPFDITSVPHLDPGELRIGGRGVYLIRALMDELSCRRHGEHGNVLRMVKRRSDNSPVRNCG